jgi:hypothetical protein
LAGDAGQGLQLWPQVATLSLRTQRSPQRWKPVLQVKPHCVPSHVGVALAGGAGHASHELPQLPMLLSSVHCCPHACCPVGHAQVPALHAAPIGQSTERAQPGMHWRVVGLHW